MTQAELKSKFEQHREFRDIQKRNNFIEECYNNSEIEEYAYTDSNSEGISFVYFNLKK